MFLDWASSSLHLGSCDLAFPAAAQNALRLFICQIKLSLDRILDGGTISHLRSLLLTRPPLDLGGRTTSLLQSLFLTKPAFYLGWGPLLVCDHCFYWMFCIIITPFIRLFWKLVTRTKPLRLYIYWVLDGGTASHLQSLLLTNPPLDLRWRTTSFTIIAFFFGRCTSLYSLFLYASSGFAGNPDPIFCEILALAIKFID